MNKYVVGKEIFMALEKISSFIPAPIYWEDINSVILGANNEVLTAVGLKSLDDYIGKTLYELYPKDLADNIKTHNEEVMRTGAIMRQEEAITDHNTGEIKYFTAVKAPLYDEKGTVIGVIGTSIDITERKKMELEIHDARIAAEAANNAKSEFIRNMEHQLRTPFSGVYSIVQMLFEAETDPEKKELLELTYQSAKEFLDLLNNIIEFSRNEVDSSALMHKKFNLKTLLANMIIMEKAAAVSKNIKLTSTYPDDLPEIFIGDPNRVKRLILNLLGNAIKFTREGNVSVEIKLAKQIDEKNLILELIISDTGIGIAEDKQQYVYEKFYRLHPANHNTYKGAGLGLYVVKQIINDLEGEIDVESSPNKGTRFICTLPFKKPLLDRC